MSKPSSSQPATIHGSALVIGQHGVLVLGVSGSGKSSLVNALVGQNASDSQFCRWVGDDRLHIDRHNGVVIARPADNLRAKRERSFLGIEEGPYLESAVIDLVVELTPMEKMERMPEPVSHADYPSLPLLKVPERDAQLGLSLILARISTL